MKPISHARRLPEARKESMGQSKAFVLFLLRENPTVETVGVTVRKSDGAIVGIKVGSTQVGAQVLDPWSGLPVSWADIDGHPRWGRSDLASTGSYESRVCSREELLSVLG